MTIKFRNRLTLVVFILFLVLFSFELSTFLIKLFTDGITFPKVYLPEDSSLFLFKFNPYFAVASILFLGLYGCLACGFILTSFTKTQAPHTVFFLLFLLAVEASSFRIFVPLFYISNTFNRLTIISGNISIFSELLAPFGLLGTITFTSAEERQNIERNLILLLLGAIFLATIIPVNTAVVLPCFSMGYGFSLLIEITITVFLILSSLTNIYFTVKKDSSVGISAGFIFIAAGYPALFHCSNLAALIFGVISITAGTIIYLKSLYNQYLWND